MNPDLVTWIWCGVLAFHLLSIAYWTGGSLIMTQTDRAAFRNAGSLEEQALRLTAYRRFYRILWHVAPLAVITGMALMAYRVTHGGISWTYHVMGFIGLLMFFIFFYTDMSPLKKASRSLRPDPILLHKIRKMTMAMGFWGVIAIILGALGNFGL